MDEINVNRQRLVDTARKLLCKTAGLEQRIHMEHLKIALRVVEPDLSDKLVPECVYRCGCPNPNGCEWFDRTAARHLNMSSTNISQRYDAYNEVFYGDKCTCAD